MKLICLNHLTFLRKIDLVDLSGLDIVNLYFGKIYQKFANVLTAYKMDLSFSSS